MTDLQIVSIIVGLVYMFLIPAVGHRLPQPINIIFLLYSLIFFITHHLQGIWISYHFETRLLRGFFYKGESHNYLDSQIMLDAMILNLAFFLMVLMPASLHIFFQSAKSVQPDTKIKSKLYF